MEIGNIANKLEGDFPWARQWAILGDPAGCETLGGTDDFKLGNVRALLWRAASFWFFLFWSAGRLAYPPRFFY